MKALDLNLLTALDALLDTGSVSAAAQRVHLSTPAMSHTLARIREALGDAILVRAGRGLVPTPRAVELREPVRRLVAEARELMQPGQAQALAHVQREFVVRAPDGFGIVHGAPLLTALRATMPLARLRFVPESDSDAAALREGRIDLDIGTVQDRGPEILTALLFEQQVVAAVRQGHALTAARLTLKRLAAEQHVAVVSRSPARGARDAMTRLLADAGFERAVALTVPSTYGALMAAARSDLVACASEPMVRGVAAGLGLQMLVLPVAVPAEQVVQAWHPRLDADAAHRCLRACVQAQATHRVAQALRGPQRHRDLLALAAAPGGLSAPKPPKVPPRSRPARAAATR
jgi:DNA-binding transcriptional LysR family regulator